MKIATVGTSVITHHFIDALKHEPFFELSHVYSRSEEKGNELAHQYDVKVITDWNELLSNPEIEVIYLATPNDVHFAQCIDVLKAKKHVICEKPFVSNSREFREIMKVVHETKYFCFDAMTVMHLPNLKVIKEALVNIEPIKLMTSAMVQYSSRYDLLLQGTVPNIFDLDHSGGALMDLGVYPLGLSIALFGKPDSLHYECNKYVNGVDLSGVITLKYPDKVIANIIAKDSRGQNFTYISGEKGAIVVPEQASRLVSVQLVTPKETLELGVEQARNAMVHEIQAFAQIIKNNDWKVYQSHMDNTELLMSCLDELRNQANIVFKADLI
jgi:scyllo-inositol 2-dehydrogenase (NADP+)